MMTWSRRNVMLNFFRSFLSLDVSKWIYQNITQSSFIRSISIMPDLNGGPLLKKMVPNLSLRQESNILTASHIAQTAYIRAMFQ